MFLLNAAVTAGWMVILASSARNLPKDVKDNIASHQDAVDKIQQLVEGDFKHLAFEKLRDLTDEHGHRVSGSQSLEEAIDYVIAEMNKEGFSSVYTENVTVPYWVRGEEYATMLTPREQKMQILGLGSSIGTQNFTDGKVTAEIIVVKTFEELEEKKADAVGKIVVFNQEWEGYGETVKYRHGADKASAAGAVATLIRSVADFSLYTPHTGIQDYGENAKIPTACLTHEDADLLQRLYDAGENVTVEILMQDENMENTTSRNIIAEIEGSESPDEIVVFGGHIDSWDVGAGVMDDGGGCIVSWQVLSIINKLGLTPKRTLRCVLWTSEEVGLIGGEAYYDAHKDKIDNMILMMEADYGIFNPLGLKFDGSGLARAYMEEIMELLEGIGTTGLVEGAETPDLSMWPEEVPKASLDIENERYFWYHHTHADTITMLNPNDLDKCSIVWAAAAYVVANLDNPLPRTGDYPSTPTSAAVSRHLSLTLLLVMLTAGFITARQARR